MTKTEKWEPAIDFRKCYLAVYPGKTTCVFLSRETYVMMGRPKKVIVSLIGDTIALSPALKYGNEVKLNPAGQPYIVCPALGSFIGPDGRALFDYDEQIWRWRWFYFRCASSSRRPVPPNKSPMMPRAR